MSKLRWLSVALLTLATTSAAHAQTAPFSTLGLTTLFGQETPTFIPECLKCWQELWSLGNYQEAELLANIACRLDPTNVAAQHAVVLSEIMQGLTGAKDGCKTCTGTCTGLQCARPLSEFNETGFWSWTPSPVERIEQKLDEPISLSFEDTPLHQVIDDLRELAGVNIIADRAALQDANISLDTPLTLVGDDISLRSALNILVDQTKLTYVIRDEVLQITTKEKARGRLRTVAYPVAELVRPDTAIARHLASGADEPTPPGQTVEDLLISLIQRTIAPETWQDGGGRGAVQFFPLGQALVISQTQDVQEDIAALLASLRLLQKEMQGAAKGAQVSAAEAACYAAAGAAGSCQVAAAKEAPACPACAKAGVLLPDCCCAAQAKTQAKACPCTAQAAPSGSFLFGLGFNSNSGIVGNIVLNNLDIFGGATKAPATKASPTCACDTNCGCCKSAAPDKSARSIMVLPYPTTWFQEGSYDALHCDSLDVHVTPAPRMAAGSVFAVTPPIYVSGPYAVPPLAVPPSPLRGFEPGSSSAVFTRAQLTQNHPASAAENGCVLASEAVRSNLPTQPAPEDMAVAKRNVHLVTPHLEAHCERLSSAGNPDHLLLEGDVLLICHRNGQTLRIQGERVHVHLSDGTFTVESMAEPRKPVSASRMRFASPADYQVQPATYPPPWEMVRPVRPVEGSWEYTPYKPEE